MTVGPLPLVGPPKAEPGSISQSHEAMGPSEQPASSFKLQELPGNDAEKQAFTDAGAGVVVVVVVGVVVVVTVEVVVVVTVVVLAGVVEVVGVVVFVGVVEVVGVVEDPSRPGGASCSPPVAATTTPPVPAAATPPIAIAVPIEGPPPSPVNTPVDARVPMIPAASKPGGMAGPPASTDPTVISGGTLATSSP